MVAVINLRPAGAAVRGTIVATYGTNLASEVDCRIRLTSSGHSEPNAIGQRNVRQLRETGPAVRRMPHAACGRIGASQPDIIDLVVNGHDLGRRGQASTDGRRKAGAVSADVEHAIREAVELVGCDAVSPDLRLRRKTRNRGPGESRGGPVG